MGVPLEPTVGNYVFFFESRDQSQTDCVGEITVQSVTLAGLSVSVPDRPVNF